MTSSQRPNKAQVGAAVSAETRAAEEEKREFIRAENEDDDGYDPYSDRRPVPEPLFERDPWN